MKIFQIYNGFCHWDASSTVPNLEYTKTHFAPDCVFVEAPDYVFEGWGFDPFKKGDERFLKPEPPEGWLYDDRTGCFYPEKEDPPPPTNPVDIYKDFAEAMNILTSGL